MARIYKTNMASSDTVLSERITLLNRAGRLIEVTYMSHAEGTFEVKLSPQSEANSPTAFLGRLLLDKQFRGDLEATSRGQMLSAGSPAEGSAGYVAIEQVTGRLGGREGSFILQHNGIMRRGKGELTITVVPDSGTGELAGIEGTMTINVTDDGHFYAFKYTLPVPN
jgi:hypothetical protein